MATTTSHTLSDREEIALYPEPKLSTSSYNNRITDWLDSTVAGEVMRGNKLREIKPLSVEPHSGFPIILQPNNARKGHKRKIHNALNKTHHGVMCCNRKSPYPKTNLYSSSYSSSPRTKICTKDKKSKNQTKCPMRIAELAVPTKRHCIDTWRYKSYLLPEIMVDRLKQHVMDLKPVVQIPDAIHCFQRRKTETKKCAKDHINNSKIKLPLRYKETKGLCLLFACGIVRKLLRPMNIKLNSDLQNVSRVVGNDIMKIYKYKKCMKKDHLQKYMAVHNDISNKITVWIAGILEDLNYKLLEDDLRDLEEEEGPVLDFLDDVVDKVLDICVPEPLKVSIEDRTESKRDDTFNNLQTPQSSDNLFPSDNDHFRNEIDKLIDKHIEPESTGIQEFKTEEEYFQNEIINIIDNFIKKSVIDLQEMKTDFFDEELQMQGKILQDDKKLTNVEDIQHEIDNITNSRDSDGMEYDVGLNEAVEVLKASDNLNVNEKNKQEPNNIENNEQKVKGSESIANNEENHQESENLQYNEETQQESDNLEHKEQKLKESEKNANSEAYQQELDNLKNNEDNQQQQTTFNEENLQKPENLEVKYDTENIKFNEENQQESKNYENNEENLKELENLENEENQQQSENAEFNEENKGEINKSEAMDEIFEDADNGSIQVMFSISDMVNYGEDILSASPDKTNFENKHKSFHSSADADLLKRNIFFAEPNDHILSNADETWPNDLSLCDVFMKPSSSATKSIISLGNIAESEEIYTISSQANIRQHCIKYEETGVIKSNTSILKVKQTNTKDIQDNNGVDQGSKDEILEIISTQEKCESNLGSTMNEIKSGVQRFAKDHIKDNLESPWKVLLNTAPSWITQAIGDPPAGLTLTQAIPKLSQKDFNKWCTDLEQGFKNLQVWRDWLRATCNEIEYLFRLKKFVERYGCLCLNKKYSKNWMHFNNNLVEDAVLWKKVNECTHIKFKTFRKYYSNIEIISTKDPRRCACKNNVRKQSILAQYII